MTETDRHRETETETDRQTDGHKIGTETDRQRETETETDRQTDRHKTVTEVDRQRETGMQRQRNRRRERWIKTGGRAVRQQKRESQRGRYGERGKGGEIVCLLVAYRPSNMRVYLRDGSAQTILRAATLR